MNLQSGGAGQNELHLDFKMKRRSLEIQAKETKKKREGACKTVGALNEKKTKVVVNPLTAAAAVSGALLRFHTWGKEG